MATIHPHSEAGKYLASPTVDLIPKVTRTQNSVAPSKTNKRWGAKRHQSSKSEIAGAIYSALTCILIAFLLGFQVLGVLASSIQTTYTRSIGQDPTLGPYETGKDNDVPFSDRVIVCIENHDQYIPILLDEVLPPNGDLGLTAVVDTIGKSIAGYRVIQRSGHTLDSTTFAIYTRMCTLANQAIIPIFALCNELGYKVSNGNLQVVVGVDGNDTLSIHNSLPFLAMPYYDNAPNARIAIPGIDGSSCMIHLYDDVENVDSRVLIIRGVNRTVREAKTEEWLQRPGGTWRNGWYEDKENIKWYSAMMTTSIEPRLLPTKDRYFDVKATNYVEIDCAQSTMCRDSTVRQQWGPKIQVDLNILESTSIVIYNGSQYGVFWFDGSVLQTVRSAYDWPMFVSNMTVMLLLFRWTIALVALYLGYCQGHSRLHYAGIGVLSHSASFQLLPFLLLPRLDNILTVFFSIGCVFQGQQNALSDTWFVMYPSTIEFVLVYYSFLGTLAKIMRRRITDILFVPTIFALSGIHYYRYELLGWHWLGIKDSVIPALVSSDEMKNLTLGQFFTSDIALRLNGNVTRLFVLKLAVLGVSLIPLLITCPIRVYREPLTALQGIEKSLSIRASNIAGLGRSDIYVNGIASNATADSASKVRPIGASRALNSYELVRLGYVVYGGQFLLSLDDWDSISTLAALNCIDHGVEVFEVQESPRIKSRVEMREHMTLVPINDPRLLGVSSWDISTREFLC